MNGAADAMTPKFADNLESATADFAFDGAANIFGAIACARGDERMAEGSFSTTREFARYLAGWRNFYGEGGVCVIAVLFGGEIELHEVAGLNDAIARNAMNDFVVDTDTHVTGKIVNHRRRRVSAVGGENSCAGFGYFPGRDAWRDSRGHGAENCGDDFAAGAEFIELFRRGD